jgi:hypothetical protein
MAKVSKRYDTTTSPDQLGLDPAISLRVWLNPPQNVLNKVFGAADERGEAFHALYGTSEPQTLEIEADDGSTTSVILDFRTPEAARATIERNDLPLDVANWLFDVPYAAIRYRREIISDVLPLSFGKGSRA